MSDSIPLNTALEGLNEMKFQPGPNLCTELEKVFQEVIDYKKSLQDNSNSEIIKMVVNYVRETAGKKILSVIKQYTGLNLELHLYRNFTCEFAVWWYFNKLMTKRDSSTIAVILERMTGNLSNTIYKKYARKYDNVKTQEELESISRELLKDKGAVTAAMTEKYSLNGRLYFCPFAAFLIQETYEKNVEPFTAKELAAIIAHECGHVIAFFACITDICYKKDILYAAAKQYINSADPDIQNRIALSIVKEHFPEQTEKIMKKLEDYRLHHSSTAAKMASNVIYAALLLVLRLMLGSLKICVTCIYKLFSTFIRGPLDHMASYNSEKRSDFVNDISTNKFMEEELADEYVSKLGYSSNLISALDKLHKWERYTGGYTNVNGPSMFTRLRPWLIATLFTDCLEDGVHPGELQRQENAIMNIMKAFKDADCSPELLDEYMTAYKDIKALHDSNTLEKRWMRASHLISQFFNYIIDTPYEMLYSGRFKQEYETLFRQVKQLMGNQLYALSYGLKQKDNNEQ